MRAHFYLKKIFIREVWMMVGLSVLLESHESSMFRSCKMSKPGQIVIKQTASSMKSSSTSKPSSFSSSSSPGFVVGVDQFLHQCFLCKQRLLENKDIFMYMGEMAFCSEECRLEHMNRESNENGAGQQIEEVEEVVKDHEVKKKSLFSADCSPPRIHVGKKGYKSQANGGIAC